MQSELIDFEIKSESEQHCCGRDHKGVDFNINLVVVRAENLCRKWIYISLESFVFETEHIPRYSACFFIASADV